jgi:serine/threonine protein kinase
MAEQQKPIVRKLASKIIKPGMDTREVVARFEAERQALAITDHPNIARVLDGGATESGRPYFVMELERQALAIMDHTNIARVLDGGATESGRPYFVMELVKGRLRRSH